MLPIGAKTPSIESLPVSLVRGLSGTFAVVVHTSTHEIQGCGHRGGENKTIFAPSVGGGRSHAAASVLKCMLAWSKILQSNGRGRGSPGGIRYCQDHLIGTWSAELDERGCGVPGRNSDRWESSRRLPRIRKWTCIGAGRLRRVQTNLARIGRS